MTIDIFESVKMDQIPEVENAKALMHEATTWSVMKWLREKKHVRKTADQANAALDQMNEAVKNQWSDKVRVAYQSLITTASQDRPLAKQPPPAIDAEMRAIVSRIKEADDEADRARVEAENTFDEAEKQLSTRLAREGCQKAIRSWELHEKAIRKAEAIIHPR